MKKMIAFCGLDCEKCDAYIATKNDDQTLREKTAKLWSELNNALILPEHINCDGCRADGRKTMFCESLCGIRQCAMKHGVTTCGDCPEMETCPTLKAVTANSTEAQKNLRNKEYGNNDQIMNIHLIEKNEREEALQLVKEVFMEFEAPDYCDEGIADFMHAISDESYLNMHHFYGAYQENKLVGVIATRNDHHHIGLLFVYKNYQRKGIGRQLIQHILTLKDETPITVNASPYGHEFYKKLGFVDTSDEQITNGVRYYPMQRC